MPDADQRAAAGLRVFFPAYNDSGTIASLVIAAVRTAQRLTSDYEVIVVDDGSADGTAAILDELARVYPQVLVVHPTASAACDAAVGTGTDALAIGLRVLGIGRGDEVIRSPLSAAYTALAIVMVGARPVFADIDPGRLTMEPAATADAVTRRTRAIIPVHLYGQAAEMPALMEVARRHRLAVPRQPAFASQRPAQCPVADRISAGVFSLPLHPGLAPQAIEEVAAALHAFQAAV
jgi:glycosyltransferase involved in cell wall biosynthesis